MISKKRSTKHRITAASVASILCLSSAQNLDFSSTFAEDEVSYRTSYTVYGDINDDKSIDSFDVILMRQKVEAGEYNKALDFNCDDSVDSEDLSMLNDYVLGAKYLFSNYLDDDADEDEICDIFEISILGTNPDSKDTDGDTLTDYEEMIYTNTSPIEKHTRGLSVTDAEDDPDEDKLSNKEELLKGTDPDIKDSDKDGLSDYDEIYVHKTDPLLPDSDKDGLDDGSEVKFKLDPNDSESSGTADGEFVISQVINADNSILSSINTNDNPYALSIDIETNGDAEKALSVNESSFSSITENDAMIGSTIDVSISEKCNPEKIVLNFNIKSDSIENSLGLFSSLEEFKNIKRLNVFRFDMDEGMLLPVDTEFDVENDTLFAEVNETGTYCIMDMEIWLHNIGINMPEGSTESSDVSTTELKMNSASIQSGIDSRIYENGSQRYQLIDSLDLTWAEAKEYCESVGGHLLTITSQEEEEFIEKNVLSKGMKNSYWLGGYRDGNTWKWTTNESFGYTKWWAGKPDNYRGVENKLSIYRLPNPVFKADSSNYWNDLNGNGIVVNEDFFGVENIGFICEWEFGKDLYQILLPTKWKTIALKGMLYPNTRADSDDDGLTDWEEVDASKIKVYNNGSLELPEFKMADLIPGRYKNGSDYDFLNKDYLPRKYLPILSDPTDKDSDDDGFEDLIDYDPLFYDEINGLLYQTKYKIGIGYNEGEIHEDLRSNDLSKDEIIKINSLFKLQLDSTEEELYQNFETLVGLFSWGKESDDICFDLINKFRYGTTDGVIGINTKDGLVFLPTYTSEKLSKRVFNDEQVLQYLSDIDTEFSLQMKKNKGDLIKTKRNMQDYMEIRGSGNIAFSKDNMKYLTSGMTLSINDMWGSSVNIDSIELTDNSYKAILHVRLYDDFGLDPPDVDKKKKYVYLNGFRAWFVLQHFDKFNGKPFINLFDTYLQVSGSM